MKPNRIKAFIKGFKKGMSDDRDLAKEMATKTDRELLDMFSSPDGWFSETLDAAAKELHRRNIDPHLAVREAVQIETVVPSVPQSAEETVVKLPAISYKKALRLDRSFQVWRELLAAWVIFGFFGIFISGEAYTTFSKTVDYIRGSASSDVSGLNPQLAETIRRLSPHIDQLERLDPLIKFSTIVTFGCWCWAIYVRRQFRRKSSKGPTVLLWLLSTKFAFTSFVALSTWGIPMFAGGASFFL